MVDDRLVYLRVEQWVGQGATVPGEVVRLPFGGAGDAGGVDETAGIVDSQVGAQLVG